MELTDRYEFGTKLFNSTTPLLKNGERCVCSKNVDMVEPSAIEMQQPSLIKSPCIKECFEFKQASRTHKTSGETEVGYFLTCGANPVFIKVLEAKENKPKLHLI